jgi:hypothetical protein
LILVGIGGEWEGPSSDETRFRHGLITMCAAEIIRSRLWHFISVGGAGMAPKLI